MDLLAGSMAPSLHTMAASLVVHITPPLAMIQEGSQAGPGVKNRVDEDDRRFPAWSRCRE